MNFRASTVLRSARWAARCAGLALIGGCASDSKFPPAPVTAATQDYTYLVGPGDNIHIIVWRNPELSLSVPVRPAG
jgi:polysaccharide export outer membrane protein